MKKVEKKRLSVVRFELQQKRQDPFLPHVAF